MFLKPVFALALLAVSAVAAAAGSPVFGSVVAIGGSASDIALDESRGFLYVANMGASVIDVMSTVDNALQSSMDVEPFPGAIALSPGAQYLLVAHYCNGGPTAPPCANAITSLHLTDNSRQTFSLADPPLGLAFLKNGQALVITTTAILFMDPASGQTQPFQTIASIAQTLPVPLATFPGQILQAALVASSDGNTVWGIASAGTSTQLIFQFSASANSISASIYASSPLLLPRISSAADGSYAMIGYALIGARGILKGRYPDAIASVNITGSAVDSVNGIIYAQFPDANQPGGPAIGSATATRPPAMLIVDSDNLTFRDRISIPEDMVGRAVLNAAATVIYVVSESGVMILPVGLLNSYHRLAASQEDLLASVSSDFCSRGAVSQSLAITDPGGGQTDFAITTSQPGVTISPAGGTTPATVQVTVDPAQIPDLGGTSSIVLSLTSKTAVNWPRPVRLLVNHSDPGGHGVIVDQPGVLSDILADQARGRFYVLRQDMNQLQVFDGISLRAIATLRTATSPTMMAMTGDRKHLLVGHDDSQLITVYDLDALQAVTPLLMPGGHFARSIAVSNAATLVLARNEGGNPAGIIDSMNFSAGTVTALVSLGIYANAVSPTGVLASSPGGANVLLASPDGNVALYTASEDTFVNSRHDLTSLSGAFAASDYGSYVVGNWILDSSLVPSGVVNPAAPPTSGFMFVDRGGFMASAASASAAGALLRTASPVNGVLAPIMVVEAPLLPSAGNSSIFLGGYGTYGSGSNSLHALNSFTRTVAPMAVLGTTVVLSTSGFTVLASSYPAAVVSASITAVVSAADGTPPVAPGGLISIYGQNLSAITLGAGAASLSSELGGACLGVNGLPLPLLFVSPGQINAQLPFNLAGSATLVIHTPTGIGSDYLFTIQPTAPSVFLAGVAGPETGLATIYRDDNNQLVTPTNPIHPGDRVTIYLTGMGQTSPAGVAGQPAPFNPLAVVLVQPVVTLGGAALSVTYAGLSPGEIGVYQINATVPSRVPEGLAIPLVIAQGVGVTTLNVRVVN